MIGPSFTLSPTPMQVQEVLSIAFSSLRANKLRSALTMLGIVIGIAAVLAVVGLGQGAQASVQDRLARLGTTLLQVNPQRERRGGVQWGDLKRLTFDDAEMLNERGRSFAAVQPQQDRELQIVYQNRNSVATVVGATPNFLQVRGFELAVGRMFTSGENRGMQSVAVLGADVVTDLGYLSPNVLVGELVRIAGRQFRVIGVMKPRGRAEAGSNSDRQVIVPARTGRFRLFKTKRLNDIYVLAAGDSLVPAAMAEIQAILRRSHKLRPDQPDDFRIRNQADFLTTAAEATEIFTYLLAGIAAVSLLVGGIGIMNIMLVSVTERTREIGIRKALGATKRVILLQFLIEALVICVAGGVAGVGVGSAMLIVMEHGFGWTTTLAPQAIAGAVIFAGAVGLGFGVWPARRAARLDPITALRYE
jgi:putative ABC transport system permease protein